RRDHDRILQERRARGDRGELLGELPVAQVHRPALDQSERSGVPEGRRAAVAEGHLIALRHGEQLAESRAYLADQGPDGLLPVRGAHHRGTLAGQACQRLGTNLRWAASEAPVGGPQLLGNGPLRLCCEGTRRQVALLARSDLEGLSMI